MKRIALIHFWLVNWAGAEKTLKTLADMYPGADIFTHVADPELLETHLPGRRVATTFVGKLPFARRAYQKYLPLMPLALEQLDLRGYDLVISSESGPAKGVIVQPDSLHVCYCHSPMRYLWDMYQDYRDQAGTLTRLFMAPLLHRLRQWDQLSAQRVDRFAANSNFVAQRIAKYYRRKARVIAPPVPLDRIALSGTSEDFFLWVGRLVPYKRPVMLIEAFNRLGLPLVVIGGGAMLPELRRLAAPHVRLLGNQPASVVEDHYARCKAVIFPGVEDFGLVPVEAMAAGKPVIAFRAGGVLDTIVDGKTGVLFSDHSVSGLIEAVRSFERGDFEFDAQHIRDHALQFSEARFKARFAQFVADPDSPD